MMEHYKEFITNGLDLVSFLLITPEITRRVMPRLRVLFIITIYVVLFAVYVAIVFASFFVLMSLWESVFGPHFRPPNWVMDIIAGGSVALGVGVFMLSAALLIFVFDLNEWDRKASKYFAMTAIFTFILARCLSVII
jgi:hypothetical protein